MKCCISDLPTVPYFSACYNNTIALCFFLYKRVEDSLRYFSRFVVRIYIIAFYAYYNYSVHVVVM